MAESGCGLWHSLYPRLWKKRGRLWYRCNGARPNLPNPGLHGECDTYTIADSNGDGDSDGYLYTDCYSHSDRDRNGDGDSDSDGDGDGDGNSHSNCYSYSSGNSNSDSYRDCHTYLYSIKYRIPAD
jgi:hypothetical protein